MEAWDGTRRVELGAAKRRAVLAVLAMNLNRVVPVDRLIDEVWASEPPAAATAALQTYIAGLRRSLEPETPSRAPFHVVVTQAPGYVLRVQPDDVDAARFERLLSDGQGALADGRPGPARDALVEGLALWRGVPYAEFAYEAFALGEVARLSELRAVAQETKAEADLALGRHASAVAELEGLAAAEPLRERRSELLALALYRSGRQAEALRALNRARRVLADELGVDPGPALCRLEAAILAHAQALEWRGPGPSMTVREPVAPETPGTAPGTAPVGGTAAPGPLGAAPAPSPLHLSADATGPAREPRWSAASAAAPLVGRQRALAVFETVLTDLDAGGGRVALVSGEPGIGKTRLAQEVASRASGRGALVVWGAAREADGAPPYWPWSEVFQDLVAADGDSLRAAAGPDGPIIAGLFPTLPDLLGEPGRDPPDDPAVARFHLFEAVASVLVRFADRRRLVVVLDDLHWADTASAEMAAAIATAADRAAILFLLTYRDVDPGPSPALTEALGAIARLPRVVHLRLEGLEDEDAATYLAAVAGVDVPPVVAADIRARTEGNPFFMGELGRLMAAESHRAATGRAAGLVPPGVRHVIRRRLNRLPEATNLLLDSASVIGRTFDLGAAADVSGIDDDQALELVDPAVAAGLVAEDRESAGRYRFSHDLVRDTMYSGIGPARRARLHRRVGEAIEMLGDDAGRVAELAHHFARGGRACVDKAIVYALAAAEEAQSQLAYEAAEDHLRAAIGLLRAQPATPERVGRELVGQVRLGHLLAITRGQSVPEAHHAYDRASELFRNGATDPAALAALWGVFMSLFVGGAEQSRELAEEMQARALRFGDANFMLASTVGLGMSAMMAGRLTDATESLGEAITLGDTLAAPSLQDIFQWDPRVISRSYLAVVTALRGAGDEAIALSRDATERALAFGHPFTIGVALLLRGWAGLVTKDVADVRHVSDTALHYAAEHGLGTIGTVATVHHSWVASFDGDTRAPADMAAAIDAYERSGANAASTTFRALLAEILLSHDRIADAARVVDRGLRDANRHGHRHHLAELLRMRAEVLLAGPSPEWDRAADYLQRAVAVAHEQGAKTFEAVAGRRLQALLGTARA